MDPTPIATATDTLIKLVSTTCSTLNTRISESDHADQIAKDLAAEANALKQTLLEVDSVLKQPSVTSVPNRIATSDSEPLWDIFHGCLKDGQLTILQLDSSLDAVNHQFPARAGRTSTQVKSNLKQDEFNSTRNQIRLHSITLGTASQLVTLRATYLTPEPVIGGLGPKIEILQKSLRDMAACMQHQGDNTSHRPPTPAPSVPSSTQALYSLGQRVLAEAITISRSSVDHASCYGDETDSEAIVRTMGCMPVPIPHDPSYATSSTTPLDASQLGPRSVNSGVEAAEIQPPTLQSETDFEESEFEAEFELEIAQGLLDKGKELFESSNYHGAVGFLQKGIAACNRLPQNLRSQLDVIEIPLMIATCKYHLEEIDEANRDLTMLVRRESFSDQDAVRKCQISHLLSQICLIKKEFGVAELHCRSSLKGRRRLLGKSHQDYFSSLSLLSEICAIRGKDEEAAVFKAMVPTDFHHSADMVRLKARIEGRDPVGKSGQRSVHAPHRDHGPWANQSIEQLVTDPRRSLGIGGTENPMPSGAQLSDSASPTQTPRASSYQVDFDRKPEILKGHTKGVCGVAFLPDGSLLASASDDATIRLWDPTTGREVRRLEGHTKSIDGLTFSSNGLYIASASWDKTVRLWDAKNGQESQKLKGHTNWINGVAFSPDSLLLAVASDDTTVRLYDPKTGRKIRKFGGHTKAVYGVAFSPDGSLLASASSDKTIRLWDPKTGREVHKLEGHTDRLSGVTFSPKGSLLASASMDTTIRLWDPKTGQETRKLEGHTKWISRVVFSPDGLLLASASMDATIRLWDPRTGQEVQKLSASSPCWTLAFSPNGSLLLASGTADGEVQLWKAP